MASELLTALALSVWAAACIYDWLGTKLLWAFRPLIAGFGAGLIVGDVGLGMAIGAIVELATLGVYSYGGVSVPDYSTGAIVGTAVGTAATGVFADKVGIGLLVGLPAAVALIGLDTLAKTLTVFWMHRADRYAANANSRGLTAMHFTAFIPHGLARAVPTFIIVMVLGRPLVQSFQALLPPMFAPAMQTFAGILPALGFALLLTMMPVKRYWYFLLAGFLLVAYLKLPLIGVVVFALDITVLFMALRRPTSYSQAPVQQPITSHQGARPLGYEREGV